MGCRLGPTFADAFMNKLEINNLTKLNSLGVILYKRYVDDTFVILKSRDNAQTVLDFLNTLHPNIKFTTEMEKNGCLPFLDVLVKRKGDRL